MQGLFSNSGIQKLYIFIVESREGACILYFMIYRPQKKQEKKDAAMRSSLEIGDQVTTIGGVIGRVVAIKDDTFVLETGADRVKIRFTKTAISAVEKLNMDKADKK